MEKKAGKGNENNGPEKDAPELGRGVHRRQLVRVEQHDTPPSPGPAHPEPGRLAPNGDPAFRQCFFRVCHFCFPHPNRCTVRARARWSCHCSIGPSNWYSVPSAVVTVIFRIPSQLAPFLAFLHSTLVTWSSGMTVTPSPPAATFLAASLRPIPCQTHHPAAYQMATSPHPIVWNR